nr:retrovirus-related Pol polyprotein from transposon TNT 1-94 [Tanacetum cinerariifolium]
MSSDTKLTKDKEYESVDSTKYRGMIGSLLYITTSRPDIMFSVYLCARFQEAPKTSHLEAVKHIFRYINSTTRLGLWYPKGTGIETVIYADSDHAGDYVDRKSTSGICTFMGCCFTSWFLKKQTDLAISTTKVEYVSTGKACKQALWMKQALIDYDVRLDDVPIMSSLRIRHEKEIDVHDHQILTREIMQTLKPLEEIVWENVSVWGETYVLYDRVMNPLTAQQERKTRKDRGTRRGHHSTSFSSAFNQPSSSHLNDNDDDENDEGTSRASTPSPTRFVNSLINEVPRVFQNPPNINPDMEPFYTRQTEIINRQVHLQDEQRGSDDSLLRLRVPSNVDILAGKPVLDPDCSHARYLSKATGQPSWLQSCPVFGQPHQGCGCNHGRCLYHFHVRRVTMNVLGLQPCRLFLNTHVFVDVSWHVASMVVIVTVVGERSPELD